MNTGEFARLCGVEKRTLFHYDAIGLLKPDTVRENGYRDYGRAQLEQMDMIKLLQGAGYSLREIGEILSRPTDERRDYFFDATERISRQIESLQEMQSYIEKKKRLWDQYREWKEKEQQYSIYQERICCEIKPLQQGTHYFCFLNDGNFDGGLFCDDGRRFICKDSPAGNAVEGRAISFFLENANMLTDMLGTIRILLTRYGFHGDGKYFIYPVPHLLLEEPQLGIVRVTVFERRELSVDTD